MHARCEVCNAPVVQASGACAFCHSPVTGEGDPQELLDYLAARLPRPDVKHALLGRGRIREVTLRGKVSSFRARLRNGRLDVEPNVRLDEWVDMLLVEVSRLAASNPDVRRAVSRAGWAFR